MLCSSDIVNNKELGALHEIEKGREGVSMSTYDSEEEMTHGVDNDCSSNSNEVGSQSSEDSFRMKTEEDFDQEKVEIRY